MFDALSYREALLQATLLILRHCPLAQVGMRYYNKRKNKYYCPIINLDKLWALKGEEVRDAPAPQAPHGCHPMPIRGSTSVHSPYVVDSHNNLLMYRLR